MANAAQKAAKRLLRDFAEVEQLQVSIKGPSDFVSQADLRAEQTLKEELSKARPGYAFLMEESGASGSDGTSTVGNELSSMCSPVASGDVASIVLMRTMVRLRRFSSDPTRAASSAMDGSCPSSRRSDSRAASSSRR